MSVLTRSVRIRGWLVASQAVQISLRALVVCKQKGADALSPWRVQADETAARLEALRAKTAGIPSGMARCTVLSLLSRIEDAHEATRLSSDADHAIAELPPLAAELRDLDVDCLFRI